MSGEAFACNANEDCVAGFWCDEGRCQPGQPQCVEDADCPDGRICQDQICGEIGDGRCREDTDCAGDKVCEAGECVPQVAPGCGDDRPCPEGFACVDGACQAAWAEVCNGQDDDRDGAVDEDAPAAGLDCPPVGVGACTVERQAACIDGAVRCPDVPPGAATDEICNGADDDCDGGTDEGFRLGERCVAGEGACERPGVVECDGAGGTRCAAEPGEPADDEICDGADNDCDGEIDEGFAVGEPCMAGEGACQRAGEYVCGDAGQIECTAEPGQPAAAEACNDQDDDCDGSVDEDFQLDEPCGLGACAGLGLRRCLEDGSGFECVAVGADIETCNGQDDDCDGSIDEDFQLNEPCGVGACAGRGIRRCLGNGDGFACDLVGQQPEVCNGQDDDCDGATDEDVDPAVLEQCSAGVGACERQGLVRCREGEPRCDAVPSEPEPEGCDGRDNDCDGEVDEDIVGAGCNVGVGPCQGVGQLVCEDGALICDAEPRAPEDEACDGLDNDCDGSVDEGACVGQVCVGDFECADDALCVQGRCLAICEDDDLVACCEDEPGDCGVASAWCGGPGQGLDPCPRLGFEQLAAGQCSEAGLCDAMQVVSNRAFDCRGPETDVCVDGSCEADPTCSPAACAGQPEFFGCSLEPDLARCVEGECMGWASYADVANGRGPIYQVPLLNPASPDRMEQVIDPDGVTWRDGATTMSWRAAPGPEPFEAFNLSQAHGTCFNLGPGWRLPTIYDLMSLLSAPRLVGDHVLVSRTLLFEDAAALNLPFENEAVTTRHIGGLEGRLKFLCVNSVGLAQPSIREDFQGRDLWVGFEWVRLPNQAVSAAAAEAACRAEEATLARAEELYARLDARPVNGQFRDALTGQVDGRNYFGWVGDREAVQVNLSSGRVRRANGAGDVLCVRGVNIQGCDDDADCGAGRACAAGRCEAFDGCQDDVECPDGQACLDGACLSLCLPDAAACCDLGEGPCAQRTAECRDAALDPCPRFVIEVDRFGECQGQACVESGDDATKRSLPCADLGGDVCLGGACEVVERCGPMACLNANEHAACGESARARCVEGVCWGWAASVADANGRGPTYPVPIVNAEGDFRGGGGLTFTSDRATDLHWSVFRPDGNEPPTVAPDWSAAQAACRDFRGIDRDDWRLPTVHEAISLVGKRPSVGDEGTLLTRTIVDGQAIAVAPWGQRGVPVIQRVPLDAEATYRCTLRHTGLVTHSTDRVVAGSDGWVGLEWAPLAEQVDTPALAQAACRQLPGGYRLARIEEVFARLDARPGPDGALQDAVDPNLADTTWLAIARADEGFYVRVRLSDLTVEDAAQAGPAVKPLCVRPLTQTVCDANADCPAGQVCVADGRCHGDFGG